MQLHYLSMPIHCQLHNPLPFIGECSWAMKAAKKYDKDKLNLHQAMNRPYAKQYEAVMDISFKALKWTKSWSQVPQSKGLERE